MTLNDGFERIVSDWLDEEAGRGSPGYLDEVLGRTIRTRQRPAWSSLERWLPVQTTIRFASATRMVGTVVLLVALVLALGAIAVAIGSQIQNLRPAPFGLASNGVIVYAAPDGDIHALDPATNGSRPLIAGPNIDTNPVISPDGTKFVFGRVQPGLEPVHAMIANADGTNVVPLSSRLSLKWFDFVEWSPIGTQMAVVGRVDGQTGLWTLGTNGDHKLLVAAREGSAISRIDAPQFLPGGDRIIFVGVGATEGTAGLYSIGADGNDQRTIIEPRDGTPGPAQPALSPDGTMVAFSQRAGDHSELKVITLATGDQRTIAFEGSPDDRAPRWSPDGNELLFERHSGGTYRLAIGPVEGGPVRSIGPTHPETNGGAVARFSPDGTRVLAFYASDRSSWSLAAADGSGGQLPADVISSTWQGLAPAP